MSCDFKVTNESVCCREKISSCKAVIIVFFLQKQTIAVGSKANIFFWLGPETSQVLYYVVFVLNYFNSFASIIRNKSVFNVLNANCLKMYYLNIITQLLQAKDTICVQTYESNKRLMKFVITEQFNDGRGKNQCQCSKK